MEYPIGSSKSLPPGLDKGGDGRELGVNGRTETKTPLKQDQKPDTGNNSSMPEKENDGNYQETENTQKPRGETALGQSDWDRFMDYN